MDSHGSSVSGSSAAAGGGGAGGVGKSVDRAGREAWLSALPADERRFMELVLHPDFRAVDAQIRSVGACENPVWLSGRSAVVAVATGEVVSAFSSASAPNGMVPFRCMNRRVGRCRSCSYLYQGDAFHLVRAGLLGGKGVPDAVAGHPMVFATLTAPSFGAVHRRADPGRSGDRCNGRRGSRLCRHGRPLACGSAHDDARDRRVGQPLCPACYDYHGHVLWNAHASRLWTAFTNTLYNRLAPAGGVPTSRIRRVLRAEYVRVAEYQARGVIHFHVLIRLDGPDDRGQNPPAWATAEVLCEAVRAAAGFASVAAAVSPALGERVLRFGTQLDVRPIVLAGDGDEVLAADKAAGYLAKYVTKGTEDAHGSDLPVASLRQIESGGTTEHVRALMRTCWGVGGLAEFRDLNTRRWAHMLGYRGHAATKSRRYSTTFGELRAVRARWRTSKAAVPEAAASRETVTVSQWGYAGRGWPQWVAEHADGVRLDLEEDRQLRREMRHELRAERGEAR